MGFPRYYQNEFEFLQKTFFGLSSDRKDENFRNYLTEVLERAIRKKKSKFFKMKNLSVYHSRDVPNDTGMCLGH